MPNLNFAEALIL